MGKTFVRQGRKVSETKFPSHAGQQFSLQFDLTLLERYPTFLSVVRAAVNTSGRPENHVAADCGYSPQEFSRRMADNESDPGHPFPLRKVDQLFDAIDPEMPITWLALKYLQNPEVKREQALASIERASRVLEHALAALKDNK